jgi:hypothetical protein
VGEGAAEADGEATADADEDGAGEGDREGWVMEDSGAGGVPSSRRGPGTNPTAVATTNDTRAVTCCLDGRVLLNTADLKMDMAASHSLIVAANR